MTKYCNKDKVEVIHDSPALMHFSNVGVLTLVVAEMLQSFIDVLSERSLIWREIV